MDKRFHSLNRSPLRAVVGAEGGESDPSCDLGTLTALTAARRLPQTARPPAVLRMTSHSLFAGADELEIAHQGGLYRLRQTSLGKLILTK